VSFLCGRKFDGSLTTMQRDLTMKARFTQSQIDFFKREAKKISKKMALTHSQALDVIARRETFKNWSMLMAYTTSASANEILPSAGGDDGKQENYKRALYQFIESLGDGEIHSLVRNAGSIWIDADDALNNNISSRSCVALGLAYDGSTTEYARRIGAILALDFDGIGDIFVFLDDASDDDDDDDENVSPKIGVGQILYSPVTGKSALLDCIQYSDFDSFCMRLEQHLGN